MLRLARILGSLLLALLMLLFGYLVADSGFRTLGQWSSISAAFAACALLWIVTGPALFAGGAWLLGSLGRNRIPLWIGGIAAFLSGGSLIAGVLTYVIPCSGPS